MRISRTTETVVPGSVEAEDPDQEGLRLLFWEPRPNPLGEGSPQEEQRSQLGRGQVGSEGTSGRKLTLSLCSSCTDFGDALFLCTVTPDVPSSRSQLDHKP